jgi:hypothetical protein
MHRPTATARKFHDIDSLTKVAFSLFRKRGYEATSVDMIVLVALNAARRVISQHSGSPSLPTQEKL